ncbi:MAG TPA: hypothetical protein VN642_05180 [Dongiaceae bacterium]|nr:hypothetical protein [Dongiaceae bacterium]
MDKVKASRSEELQHELVNELKVLRMAIREIAEGFILRKEGEIETLQDYLLNMPPGRLKAVVRPWMRETRALKLKPAKGRIKDLKKIDNLLTDLLNYVIEADDQEQKPKAARKKPIAGKRKGGTSPEKDAL